MIRYLCGLIFIGLLGSNLFTYVKSVSKVKDITKQLQDQISDYNRDINAYRLNNNKLRSKYSVLLSNYNSLKSSYDACTETVKQRTTEIELNKLKHSKEGFKYDKNTTSGTTKYIYF